MERRITISERVSLKALDESLLSQIKEGVNQYTVDLSNLPPTTAPDAVILLLFLVHLEQISQTRPMVIIPRRTAILSFLSNVRFFILAQSFCYVDKGLVPEPVDRREMAKRNILEITHIPAQLTEEEFSSMLRNSVHGTIIEKFNVLGAGSFAFLSPVYLELCRNVFEHSQSFGYVAAQIYPPKFQITKVTIGDLGIGIFESLKPFYEYDKNHKGKENFDRRFGPVWDETKALDIAFIPGVSSKRGNTNEERGIGLYTVLEIVKQHEGVVICRSGTSKIYLGYRHKNWTTERRCNLAFFPGTQMEVYIPWSKDNQGRK